MFDNGSTMTMQSQRNTVYNTYWSNDSNIDSGPLPALSILESVTAGWGNVNDLTYTMGTTVFKDNAYTGCNSSSSCTINTYTLSSRTAKARIITVQEAKALGCSESTKSCPIWMYNYLYKSSSNGGTAVKFVWGITITFSNLSSIEVPNFPKNGARVVVVSK